MSKDELKRMSEAGERSLFRTKKNVADRLREPKTMSRTLRTVTCKHRVSPAKTRMFLPVEPHFHYHANFAFTEARSLPHFENRSVNWCGVASHASPSYLRKHDKLSACAFNQLVSDFEMLIVTL